MRTKKKFHSLQVGIGRKTKKKTKTPHHHRGKVQLAIFLVTSNCSVPNWADSKRQRYKISGLALLTTCTVLQGFELMIPRENKVYIEEYL